MDTDLAQILASPQPLGASHVQFFMYQLLQGLHHIHSANVLHRDIKPANLLVNANCDLRICDFGLARVASAHSQAEGSHENFMTEYVATRWYRAPEIMLSWKEYTTAIDVWSVGCVLGELLGGGALFPGRDYLHQLRLITESIGSPTEDELKDIASLPARQYMTQLPPSSPVDWAERYPEAPPQCLALLARLLTFHPEKRITVAEAICSPYMAHDPSSAPGIPPSHPLFNWDFEHPQAALGIPQLQELVFEEFLALHPDWEPQLDCLSEGPDASEACLGEACLGEATLEEPCLDGFAPDAEEACLEASLF